MTLVNYALTTRAKVKLALGITDTSKDDIIDQTINGVTGYIERYCGRRRFLSTSYVEIKDPNGKKKLFLDQYPVRTLSVVEYRSGTPSTPVWNTYSADSYLLYDKEGFISFYGRLPNVPQGMRVTYTAGYLIDFTNEFTTTHTLPFELTQVCTELVVKAINTVQSEGISSQTTEGQSVSFDMPSSRLTTLQKAVLDSFKSIRYS